MTFHKEVCTEDVDQIKLWGDKMRRFNHLSFEELLDMEEELNPNIDDKYNSWDEIINIKEAIYRRIHADRDHEYRPSLENIKQNIISNLVDYGSFLKTTYRKDDQAAKYSLKRALKYDRNNQLAHYRLAFIYYKQLDYFLSTNHFKTALDINEKNVNSEYALTSQQVYYANLYLSNSALHIAKRAQEKLGEIDNHINRGSVSTLELSPLFNIISEGDSHLLNHAFVVSFNNGEKYCSREECDQIIEFNKPNQLIFDMSTREHLVFYNGLEVSLPIQQAELLEILMKESSEERPVTKDKVFDVFTVKEDREMPTNTYIQAISRLRQRLGMCGIPSTVIINKKYQGETGYYFEPFTSYQIIKRIEDV